MAGDCVVSGHVDDQCKPPWTIFKRAGTLWMCTCGKIYKVTWVYAFGDSARVWTYQGRLSYYAEEELLSAFNDVQENCQELLKDLAEVQKVVSGMMT